MRTLFLVFFALLLCAGAAAPIDESMLLDTKDAHVGTVEEDKNREVEEGVKQVVPVKVIAPAAATTTIGGGKELKAPTAAAPVNAAATAATGREKGHSVVNKVLKMISTHVSPHAEHKRKIVFEPVCTPAPSNLRFCDGLSYPVFRHSQHVPFDLLDYNAHKQYKKLVEHMEYTIEQKPRAHQCTDGYKQLLCAREFPHCCDIRVCGGYGPPEIQAGAKYGHANSAISPLVAAAKTVQKDKGHMGKNGKEATIATFLANGTIQIHEDANSDNSTVLVKLHHRPCLAYNSTYTPLFDCVTACARFLTIECQEMLHTSCVALCHGQAHPTCATKQLLAVAHGRSDASSFRIVSPLWWSVWGLSMLAVSLFAVSFL